jgi:hypothetical protein
VKRRAGLALLTAAAVAHACGFDDALRDYLSAGFWLPFVKHAEDFVQRGVQRLSVPYAGMRKAQGASALEQLRTGYQRIAHPHAAGDVTSLRKLLASARAQSGLGAREREELELIDAKIDLRAGSRDTAMEKLTKFAATARTPEYVSEARGWIAHIHFLRGDQTAAGKLYLDELNRKDTNLSTETLVNSLRLTYGYDGGEKLVRHLEQYFDTPEHAAFAIHLITNPQWNRQHFAPDPSFDPVAGEGPPYGRISALLRKHGNLFQTDGGSEMLAVLGMRVALRAGDPAAALQIAANVPARAPVRMQPDFLWMHGSACFLSRRYAEAEAPLLRLFRSARASASERAAAAYGLCGVYRKTRRTLDQIRMALWLRHQARGHNLGYLPGPSTIQTQTVYWAVSGWDVALLLDAEAPAEVLREYIDRYPRDPQLRLVRYALAVRLAREDQYFEAAELYTAVGANRRAARMRRLAELYSAAQQTHEGKYEMAAFLAANPERIYFNDSVWQGLQRYALIAATDTRLNRRERQAQIAAERKLRNDQEERWRAYNLLREVVRSDAPAELRERAARLALRCLRHINTERFGRAAEIAKAEAELTAWLRSHSPEA